MHYVKQYFVLAAALMIAIVILAWRVLAPSPLSADEVIAKSRLHFETVTSFESRSVHYFNPNVDEPSTETRMLVEPPTDFIMLDEDGVPRVVAIDQTIYRRSESNPGEWSRSVGEQSFGNTNEANLLIGFFPPEFFQAEHVDAAESDVYVVEGYGSRYNNLGLPSGNASWHRLKIRKSDFALVESTRFDFPSISLDEDGEISREITQPIDPDGSTPFAHMRAVTTVSRYNEDLNITPPSDSVIIVELMTTWPRDGETNVEPRGELGFRLSEPTEIMDISIEPSIELFPQISTIRL